MIRLMIFDWNGTLLDDLGPVYKSVLEIFRQYGVPPPTIEEYRDQVKAKFMDFYWRHGIPRSATADDLNKIRIEVLKGCSPREYSLVEDTVHVLNYCAGRGLKIALVSAGNSEVISQQFSQFGITKFFDLVVADALDKVGGLKVCVSHFGLEPGRAIYVDDTRDGIVAAKKAGLVTCGVTWGYNSERRVRQACPGFVIRNLRELTEVLKP